MYESEVEIVIRIVLITIVLFLTRLLQDALVHEPPFVFLKFVHIVRTNHDLLAWLLAHLLSRPLDQALAESLSWVTRMVNISLLRVASLFLLIVHFDAES